MSTEQTARQANIRAIVDYFESGVKSRTDRIGIELEHTLVHRDGSPVSYSEEHGVAWLLDQLGSVYPETTHDADGDLLGVARPGEAITIEPAAQVELSAGPFDSLDAAHAAFIDFEQLLVDTLSPVGIQVDTVGYNPVAKAADLELIPKRRYKLMNEYLGAISPFGICMMRGSASTQVAIDYTSVQDCLRKLRLAYACVPIFSLICDNSPIFEGAPRTHQLVRTEIWQKCDSERCGIVPGVMKPDFTLNDYAEYVLDTPAILVPCPCSDAENWCPDGRTFGEIYADRVMTRADVEHALSMFFTDVRLKTYIEIRPADAMPVPYALAYAALVKGLFSFDENLDALDDLFAGVSAIDIDNAKDALMAEGYAARVYGRSVGELADELVRLAEAALGSAEGGYLAPLAELVHKRQTLADL